MLHSLPAKLFDWVVFQENSRQRGVGPFPEVRSKDSGAQRESISVPFTPRYSLSAARPHPRRTPTSGSKDLHM